MGKDGVAFKIYNNYWAVLGVSIVTLPRPHCINNSTCKTNLEHLTPVYTQVCYLCSSFIKFGLDVNINTVILHKPVT